MLVTAEIQKRFDNAKNIVFMTGAGVSTSEYRIIVLRWYL